MLRSTMPTQGPDQQVLLLWNIQLSGAHLQIHKTHLIPARDKQSPHANVIAIITNHTELTLQYFSISEAYIN